MQQSSLSKEVKIPQTYLENPIVGSFSMSNFHQINQEKMTDIDHYQRGNTYSSSVTQTNQNYKESKRTNINNSYYSLNSTKMNTQNFDAKYNSTSSKLLNDHYTNSKTFIWKEIIKMNPNDPNSFSPYLMNILTSEIDQSEISKLPEEYLQKLIKLLQSICFHFINERDIISEENEQLKNDIFNLEITLNENSNNNQNNIELINSLRNQNASQRQIIEDLNFYHKSTLEKSKKNNSLINSDEEDEDENCNLQCIYCTGISFKTHKALSLHMKNCHLVNNYDGGSSSRRKNKNIAVSQIIDTKMNEMKSQLTSKLMQLERTNNFQNLSARIDNIFSRRVNPECIDVNSKYLQGAYANDINININDQHKVQFDKTVKLIADKITENNDNFNKVFQSIITDMSKFKSKITSDISNIKKNQGFNKVKNIFDSQNFNKLSKNYSLNRKKGGMNFSSSSNNLNDMNYSRNSNKNIQYLQKSNTVMSQKDIYNNNINNINTKSGRIIDNNRYSNVDLTINANNYNSNYKKKYSDFDSSFSMKSEEIEINDFYEKFVNRDKNFNDGNFEDYNQVIIPLSFEKKMNENNQINILKDDYIKKKIKKFTKNKYDNFNDIIKDDNITAKAINTFMNNLVNDVGNESGDNHYYGYYAKTLDLLFDTTKLIEMQNDFYYDNKNNIITNNSSDAKPKNKNTFKVFPSFGKHESSNHFNNNNNYNFNSSFHYNNNNNNNFNNNYNDYNNNNYNDYNNNNYNDYNNKFYNNEPHARESMESKTDFSFDLGKNNYNDNHSRKNDDGIFNCVDYQIQG